VYAKSHVIWPCFLSFHLSSHIDKMGGGVYVGFMGMGWGFDVWMWVGVGV